MKSEVHVVVKISILSVLTPCGLARRHQLSEEASALRPEGGGRMLHRSYASL
jgi:hypothetical protein